jgi:predicted ABC-type ATPase
MDATAPKCWIIGGTNGAGKSSIVQNSPELRHSGEFVNADLIAREISPDRPEAVSRLAGRRVIERLDLLIAENRSFLYETTLSSGQSIGLMSKAREAGYRVGLIFVLLKNVNLNIRRVRERVRRGGHDIPKEVIKRRYVRAFCNLPRAMQIAQESVVYENSGTSPIKLITLADGNIVQNALDRAQSSHREIAEAVATTLHLSPNVVFKSAKHI